MRVLLLLLVVMSAPLSANSNAILNRLKEGNARFVDALETNVRISPEMRQKLIHTQKPICALLACADSRVAPELIFDQWIGDLFVVRLAGNVASQAAIESLDFAANVLGVPLIIVMGHQNCGAVSAVLKHEGEEDLGEIATNIEQATKGTHTIKEAVIANVRAQVATLKKDPLLQQALKEKRIEIVGAYHDFETGKVLFL